jgi:hypothetical protein
MLLGMPIWAWALLVIVGAVIAVSRMFYGRFRAMCRGVREELTEWVSKRFPGVTVIGEQQGNLLVRLPDGSERVWEMTEVYSAVAQLPGMGADPAARAQVYEQAAQTLFPPEALSAPLSLEAHGGLIKPLLVPAEVLAEESSAGTAIHSPVPGLGLEAIYAVDIPPDKRVLTQQDAAELELEAASLHRLALENLRRDFPREMVASVIADDSGSASQIGDGFDAARLLLVPECLQPGQEVVALVPHPDMLVLLPPSILEDPEKLREGLGILECRDHPPLLNRAVRVTSGGFELI